MTCARVVVVLPARYHSSRFPGKPLAVIAGKPLIEWVYRRARVIRGISRVVVATDHDHIASAVHKFGGEVVMTSSHHCTGTDRVAEVASALDDDYVVNLQGDEPLFPPSLVEEMIEVLKGDRPTRTGGPKVTEGRSRSPLASAHLADPLLSKSARKSSESDLLSPSARGDEDNGVQPIDIVTACHPISSADEINSPNVVKVVMDGSNRALYFSRAAIPFFGAKKDVVDRECYRHIGIYAFTRESLLRFTAAAPTRLEKTEGLEQLRALEYGMKIQVIKTEY